MKHMCIDHPTSDYCSFFEMISLVRQKNYLTIYMCMYYPKRNECIDRNVRNIFMCKSPDTSFDQLLTVGRTSTVQIM